MNQEKFLTTKALKKAQEEVLSVAPAEPKPVTAGEADDIEIPKNKDTSSDVLDEPKPEVKKPEKTKPHKKTEKEEIEEAEAELKNAHVDEVVKKTEQKKIE